MNKSSTLFLKGIIVTIGVAAFALSGFILFAITKEMVDVMPVQYSFLPILLSVSLSLIPFYFALYQVLKLLNYIDKNTAFSKPSVKALRNIKNSAIAISILYVAILPFMFLFAEADDAPGVVLIGAFLAGAPVVVAVFAAVLQRLLESALDIKSENDLTV